MLSEIRIAGLGVIADATLELSQGLTVVTGETGAGKTMVVAGLGLLFGGKADPGKVRPGAERAVVEGRLVLDGSATELTDRLTELGARRDNDGALIAVRTIYPEGRSRAHAGARAVPASVLAELGEELVAMHGQSDQLRLRHASEQRAALDRFAGDDVGVPLREHRKTYHRWRAVDTELTERRSALDERAREAEALRQGLVEIDAVAPRPGEDTELVAEARRLEHAEGLQRAATTSHQALMGDPALDQGADISALLGEVRRALAEVANHDEQMSVFATRADELAALAADLAADLASYGQQIEADPARLGVINERRAALAALTRKYGERDLASVLRWADQAREQLSYVDESAEELSELEAEQNELTSALAALATTLSVARRAAADRFADEVSAELRGLAMPHARVVAQVSTRSADQRQPTITLAGDLVGITPDGVDEVELLLTPHQGAPARAVHKGASGGELSRVMLAIEVVLAAAGTPATMVFDEVDAGVGGKAAVEVGRRLARLARNHQVLVVTHLPQVAAFADRHWVVVKGSDGSVTTSGVRELLDDERPKELARMLAGMDESELGIAHAQELLKLAREG